MRAELLVEAQRGAWLQKEMERCEADVEVWRGVAEEARLQQQRHVCAARVDRLVAMEHATRHSLRHDELCVRHNLHALHTAAVAALQERAIQTSMADADAQLQALGRLIVEYCARDAFGRWLLFAEQRKRRCDARYTASVATAAAVWLDDSTRCITALCDAKLGMLLATVDAVAGRYAAVAQRLTDDLAEAQNAAEIARTERDRHVLADLQRCGALWAAFTATAAGWCAGREQLMLECRSAPVVTTPDCSDVVACLREPLWAQEASDTASTAASPLEQAMRLLSSERAALAEHVRDVIDVMRFTAAESLEAQRQQHSDVVDELLQYQAFLEGRLAAAGAVDNIGLQQRQMREARKRDEVAEMAGRIASLLAAVERSDAAREEERLRHVEEVRVLRQRLDDQQQQQQMAHMLQAAESTRADHEREVGALLQDTVRQYGRVLLALEEDVAGRHAAFRASTGMLADVHRFSDALLRRSEADLQCLAERQELACRMLRQQQQEQQEQESAASDAVRVLRAEHESEVAALMRTLHATREKATAISHELREEHEACEARRRDEVAEMAGRIASLLAAVERSDAAREEERLRHVEEVRVLRQRLEDEQQQQQQIAHMLQAAESTRADHEREVGVLLHDTVRQYGRVLLALEEDVVSRHAAFFTAAGVLLDAGQRRLSGVAAEAQQQLDALRWEAQRFEVQLQAAERRHVAECDELRSALEVERAAHRAAVAVVRERIPDPPMDSCGPTDSCEMVLESAALVVEEANCGLIDERLCALVPCGAEEEPAGRQPDETAVGSGCASPAVVRSLPAAAFRTPPRRAVSTDDVARSMVRYSRMLNEQRFKNDTRLRHLDNLVTQVDDLIERGRAVARADRSPSERDRRPHTAR
ncbi:hypothetical protein DQ04_11681020 [Trypanosoma grayi]|uniref:hypothetical protein n=1 Tax=Trypanosoma grayi TaxID=71804 RepID=UPI0004F3F5A8|nr:hypothetical protein DQ04_11681020 [Trypanosoma grayi]KEG06912.1 hypothetical protein DQ04_11681020 [Trypanosoma grayi]